ncbi:TetR/AcrR family transcriptional regulator [Azospirillum thermophilum]|uniref:TetR family transcriptional regulator n=1 Tax=Azospirillum thermophilum TaxID=2202148 RepID=A0A2S2CVI2_9PROT|nr:TetR/AcrR family transcriptional regulator [Azospirillum thermophilum]AWK88415.1 TetR family transcriptional regulator [Azospirillum thermophilum]
MEKTAPSPDPRQAAARRGRRLGFDRDAALERALRLFWERGYEGTSVADLVAAMGITPPSLYTAFGSKEALYRETLALYRAGPGRFAFRALEEEPTARAAVARILREAAAAYCDRSLPGGCMIAGAVLACAPEHGPVARSVAEMRSGAVAAIAGRIARGIAAGELPAGTDATALARFYGAVIQGMSVQARDGAGPDALAAIAEQAMAAWPPPSPSSPSPSSPASSSS